MKPLTTIRLVTALSRVSVEWWTDPRRPWLMLLRNRAGRVFRAEYAGADGWFLYAYA